MNDFTSKLLDLITGFLQKKSKTSIFSEGFLQLYKQDSEVVEEPYGRFFDAVFSACDAYCKDENLRDEYDFNERQLYERVQELYKTI